MTRRRRLSRRYAALYGDGGASALPLHIFAHRRRWPAPCVMWGPRPATETTLRSGRGEIHARSERGGGHGRRRPPPPILRSIRQHHQHRGKWWWRLPALRRLRPRGRRRGVYGVHGALPGCPCPPAPTAAVGSRTCRCHLDRPTLGRARAEERPPPSPGRAGEQLHVGAMRLPGPLGSERDRPVARSRRARRLARWPAPAGSRGMHAGFQFFFSRQTHEKRMSCA